MGAGRLSSRAPPQCVSALVPEEEPLYEESGERDLLESARRRNWLGTGEDWGREEAQTRLHYHTTSWGGNVGSILQDALVTEQVTRDPGLKAVPGGISAQALPFSLQASQGGPHSPRTAPDKDTQVLWGQKGPRGDVG